jgi:putative membrane protein
MNGMLISWLTATGAIVLTSYLLNGIQIDGFFTAFMAAAILGILNALIRPIALLITLPINILTLGFFTFVINALLLQMVSGIISGFEIHGFGSAVLGSLMISVISWLLNSFADRPRTWHTNKPGNRARRNNSNRSHTIDLERKGDDRWE